MKKKPELNGFLQQLLLKAFQRRMMTVMNDNHPHIPMHFVLSHFRCVTVIHIYMLRRNSVKEEAYTSLTRSSLEYACYIWDPYNKGEIDQLIIVQPKAARLVSETHI